MTPNLVTQKFEYPPRRTQLDLKQESEMAPIFQQLDLDPSFVLELFEAKPAPQQRNRTP
jgi:hypothetical protein